MSKNKPATTLAQFYATLHRNGYFNSRAYNIPHSIVYVTSYALRERGIVVDLNKLEDIMYDEGMLPAKAYGIPQWYIHKHMTPLYVKEAIAKKAAEKKLKLENGKDVQIRL